MNSSSSSPLPQDLPVPAWSPDDPAPLGFGLTLGMHPRYGLAAVTRVERTLHDQAQALELQVMGTQFHHVVSCCAGRELTPEDQLALVDALLDMPELALVEITALLPEERLELVTGRPGPMPPRLRIHTGEPATRAVTALYRSGRLRARDAMHCLGGFSVPVATE